jgi:hypothetical protein
MSHLAWGILVVVIIIAIFAYMSRERFVDSAVCTIDQYGQTVCTGRNMRDSTVCKLDKNGLPFCTTGSGSGPFAASTTCSLDSHGLPVCV